MAIDSTTASSVIDSARAKIAGAIKQAADATGASFDYLISTAKIESNLDPKAQASTSSARGLYQFIEQTWLATVKQAGAAFGYGNYANAISQSPSGTYSVSDPATRDQILEEEERDRRIVRIAVVFKVVRHIICPHSSRHHPG